MRDDMEGMLFICIPNIFSSYSIDRKVSFFQFSSFYRFIYASALSYQTVLRILSAPFNAAYSSATSTGNITTFFMSRIMVNSGL